MAELLERDELLGRLDALRAQGGLCVFVGGEAGVGKSALIRAFTAGKPALQGSCENLTTPTPFGPFLGIDVDADPRRVARAVLEALEDVPLLVLEDMHWADQATLDALRVLGRRIDSMPALSSRRWASSTASAPSRPPGPSGAISRRSVSRRPADRAAQPARTRRSSRPGSWTCSASSPPASATPTSRPSLCSRGERLTTTSRRSSASSAFGRVARQPPRPLSSASSKIE